jgi:hypothetical protein
VPISATGVCIGQEACKTKQTNTQTAEITQAQAGTSGDATSGPANAVQTNAGNTFTLKNRIKKEDNDQVWVGLESKGTARTLGGGNEEEKKNGKKNAKKNAKKNGKGGVTQVNALTFAPVNRARSGDAISGDVTQVQEAGIGQAATNNATVGSGNEVGDDIGEQNINCFADAGFQKALAAVGGGGGGAPGCVFFDVD